MILRIFVVFLLAFQIVSAQAKTAKATFAGGCYWCMEEPFDTLDGVLSTTTGFSRVGSSGQTVSVEAVEIVYDPEKISYEKLLEVFWKNIDPTNPDGQFCDRGPKYRSAIFYHNDRQKILAEESKFEIEKILNKQIVTPIFPAMQFAAVAESEQDFYKKNALRYKQYKIQCGRDRQLRELWGN